MLHKIVYKIWKFLDNACSRLHNIAVEDLHKTGQVKYTRFNRFVFKIENIISIPKWKIEDYWAEKGVTK